jgi:hypothetical protein
MELSGISFYPAAIVDAFIVFHAACVVYPLNFPDPLRYFYEVTGIISAHVATDE